MHRHLYVFLLFWTLAQQQQQFIVVSSFHVHGTGERSTTTCATGGRCSTLKRPSFFALQPSSSASTTGSDDTVATSSSKSIISNKQRLLELISQTPRNAPTPQSLTSQILQVVRQVEADCPSSLDDADTFLGKLKGTWNLLWTSQDPSSREAQRGPFSYINPLENQSYSNNPIAGTASSSSSSSSSSTTGRANPLLPRGIQDRLEAAGILPRNDSNTNDQGAAGGFLLNPASTQTISLSKRQVRNVVTFNTRRGGGGGGSNEETAVRPATLTVTIDFQVPFRNSEQASNASSPPRRINVTFTSCRVVVPWLRLDFVIPLTSPFGILKPVQGWLRTTYLDDEFRITRGHKGSVFILARPSASGGSAGGAAAGTGSLKKSPLSASE